MKNKSIKFFTFFLAFILVLTSCGQSAKPEETTLQEEKQVFNIGTLKDSSSFPFYYFLENSVKKDKKFVDDVQLFDSAQEMERIINNSHIDVAAVTPTTLFNLKKVSVLGVNFSDKLYVVQTGKDVNSIQNLNGKKIFVPNTGGYYEKILDLILKGNDLDFEYTIEVKDTFADVVNSVESDENSLAILTEPYITQKMYENSNFKICFDLNTYWEDLNYLYPIVTNFIVARNEIIDNYKTELNTIMEKYKKALEVIKTNPLQIADTIEGLGLGSKETSLDILGKINIVYKESPEAEEIYQYFSKILN